jgi:hypothetical protein
MTLTLKALAEEGCELGFATIGEVACYMVLRSRRISRFPSPHCSNPLSLQTREAELQKLVSGHEDDECDRLRAWNL